jgi:hypothetical protein
MCFFPNKGRATHAGAVTLPQELCSLKWITEAPPVPPEPVAMRPMGRNLKNTQLPLSRAVTHEDDENLEWAQRRARTRKQRVQLYGMRHFAAEASVNICVSSFLFYIDATPFLFRRATFRPVWSVLLQLAQTLNQCHSPWSHMVGS